jgi:hypothetical protein
MQARRVKHRIHRNGQLPCLFPLLRVRVQPVLAVPPNGGGLGVLPTVDVDSTGLVSLVRGMPAAESSLPSVRCRRSMSRLCSHSETRSRSSRSCSCPRIPPLLVPINPIKIRSLLLHLPHHMASVIRAAHICGIEWLRLARRVPGINDVGVREREELRVRVRSVQSTLDDDAPHDILERGEKDHSHRLHVRMVRGLSNGVRGQQRRARAWVVLLPSAVGARALGCAEEAGLGGDDGGEIASDTGCTARTFGRFCKRSSAPNRETPKGARDSPNPGTLTP